MTAMKDALERAGFRKEEMEIYPALIRFFKSGGEYERLRELCHRALKETLGEGQSRNSYIGPAMNADAQYQTRNEGQTQAAGQGHTWLADVPHPLSGKGQTPSAKGLADIAGPGQPIPEDEAKADMPKGRSAFSSSSGPQSRTEAIVRLPAKASVPVPPVREPSAVQIQSARYAADLTFNEIVKLRGRMLDLYRFKDLKNVRHLNNYENAIINDCIDYGRQHRIREDRKIGLSIPRAEIQKIVNRAKTAIQSKALLTMPKSKRRGKAHG